MAYEIDEVEGIIQRAISGLEYQNRPKICKIGVIHDGVFYEVAVKKTAHQDLTGKRFEKLTALHPTWSQGRHPMWTCQCDCGTFVRVRADNLIMGNTRSCGCLKSEAMRKVNRDRWGKE